MSDTKFRSQLAEGLAIPWERPQFDGSEMRRIEAVLKGDTAVQQTTISEFEKGLGDFIDSSRVVAVNNGTLAILCALLLLDPKPGQKVIAPTYTFASVINTLLLLGLEPVLIDSDPNTFNMDLDRAGEVAERDPSVAGILYVDVGGIPPDVGQLSELADRYGLWVIEDAAEAIGSDIADEPIGHRPHVTTLSFQRAKQLTTLEGGGLVLPTSDLFDRARLLRNHGMGERYDHVAFGLNFRLGALEAAVGLAQLPHLAQFISLRSDIMEIYRADLRNYARFQQVPRGVTRMSWAMAMICFKTEGARDDVRAELTRKGIETRVNWKPLHRQPFHSHLARGATYPVADEIFATSLTLPLGNGMSQEEATRITQAIKVALGDAE